MNNNIYVDIIGMLVFWRIFGEDKVMRMPILYLAKVNVNSIIYDVYNNKVSLEQIKDELFAGLQNGGLVTGICEDVNNGGNKSADNSTNGIEYQNSTYTFQEIEKSDSLALSLRTEDFMSEGDGGIWEGRTVRGKVVRSFNKKTEKQDPDSKKMRVAMVPENYSIRFFFDVEHEMVTFTTRSNFGYRQFMSAFARLLSQTMSRTEFPTEFEMFLRRDEEALQKKIDEFDVVTRVKANLVPANSNKEDIEELAREADYQLDMKDVGATSLGIEYSGSKMNVKSGPIRKMITMVGRGFGYMTISGYDKNGKHKNFNSNQAGIFTQEVSEGIAEEDFNRESADLVKKYLEKKGGGIQG